MVKKHLNDLFVLDGVLNVNARDRILREIVSNTLAHRFGKLDIKKIEPFAKNPIFDEAILKTTIPLKQIATLKVGGQNTQKLSIKE